MRAIRVTKPFSRSRASAASFVSASIVPSTSVPVESMSWYAQRTFSPPAGELGLGDEESFAANATGPRRKNARMLVDAIEHNCSKVLILTALLGSQSTYGSAP